MISLVLVAALQASPVTPPHTPQDCRVIFMSGQTRGDSNRWWLPPSDVGMGARELWLDSCEARVGRSPHRWLRR